MYSIFKTARSGNVKFFSAGDYLFDTYDTCANAAKGYAERFPSIGEGDYKPAYACVESKTKLEIKAEPYANITFKNERGVPLVLDDEGVYYTYFEVAQEVKDNLGNKLGTSEERNRFYLTSEGYLKGKNKTMNNGSKRYPIVTAIECAVTNCCCSRNYFEYGKSRSCDCEEKEFHNRRNNNKDTGIYEQNRANGNLLKFR